MTKKNLNRRDFLKRTSATMAGATLLSALSSVQSVFADDLDDLGASSGKNTDFRTLRNRYLLSPDITYFNHGSIGTIPKPVHEAHTKYLALCETNPWLYMWSEPWENAKAKTRKHVADFLGCSADELAFTHNTTEAFNLLANGLPLKKGDEIVFSSLNHVGASQCWYHYAEVKGFIVNKFQFPIQDTPKLTGDEIVKIYEKHITARTRVLVFPHVDNLVGIRYPAKEIVQMARKKGVEYIAIDGAQSVGMFPLQVRKIGADFYATSSHKWLQGPKGAGLLYINKKVQSQLKPMWVTFGQNQWQGTVRIFEDYGTRNIAEVLTLGNAVEFQRRLNLQASEKRRQILREYFQQQCTHHDNILWKSPITSSMATSIFTIAVNGKNSKDLFRELYQSHGYVFRAFQNPGWNTLRISPNNFNSFKEIDKFIKLLLV